MVTDWEIDLAHLVIGNLIGSGGSGSVYAGTYFHKDVAVKKLTLEEMGCDDFKKETDIWKQLSFPNIVQLYGVSTKPGKQCMVMARADCSLTDLLANQRDALPWIRRLEIARDIVCGMLYLHSKDILHRDLKSMNILMQDRVVKICDFGFATKKLAFKVHDSAGLKGTPQWMAPEVCSGAPCTRKSDVYSFGVILWEIAACCLPFSSFKGSSFELISKITKGLRPSCDGLEIDKLVKSLFLTLLKQCWIADPRKRPDFTAVLVTVDELIGLIDPVKYQNRKARENQARAAELHETGMALYKTRNFEEAIKSFHEALSHDNRREQTYLYLTACLMEQHHFKQALEIAVRFVEIMPTLSTSYLRKGDCLLHLKRYQEAYAVYQQGMELPDATSRFKGKLKDCVCDGNLNEADMPEFCRKYRERIAQQQDDKIAGLSRYQSIQIFMGGQRKEAVRILPLQQIQHRGLEGWLKKKSRHSRHLWQRYLFVLDFSMPPPNPPPYHIRYYKSDKEGQVGLGHEIAVGEVEVVSLADTGKGSEGHTRFNLQVSGGRVYALNADTAEDCQKWVMLLKAAAQYEREVLERAAEVARLKALQAKSGVLDVRAKGRKKNSKQNLWKRWKSSLKGPIAPVPTEHRTTAATLPTPLSTSTTPQEAGVGATAGRRSGGSGGSGGVKRRETIEEGEEGEEGEEDTGKEGEVLEFLEEEVLPLLPPEKLTLKVLEADFRTLISASPPPVLTKYPHSGRRGRRKKRVCLVDVAANTLTWKEDPDGWIDLRTVKRIERGLVTHSLKRMAKAPNAAKCFAVLTEERELSFEAASEDVCALWLQGLRAICFRKPDVDQLHVSEASSNSEQRCRVM